MTYNTGNPIGSTDARDRSDNSENLDLAVNSLSQTFVDRLGVTRDTLEGIYQKSAYYRAGTFDAGYTLTNNRQTLAYGNIEYSWSGEFPKVVSAGATPATSGGVGVGAWVDRTQETLRTDLYSTTGSTLVTDTPEEVGGVAQSLHDRTKEYGSVSEFGYAGQLVIAEDTSTAKAKLNARRRQYRDKTNYHLPNIGFKTWKRTYGSFDTAATAAIISGTKDEAYADVLGFTSDAQLADYADRDQVGLFGKTNAQDPIVTTASTTFTATSVSSSSFATAIANGDICYGMYIDTNESPKKSAKITGINAATNTLTVSGWYVIGGSGSTATPSNGTTIYVNPITKIWGINWNVGIGPTSLATDGFGFELGTFSSKADGQLSGYYAVNLGTYKAKNAFWARGATANYSIGYVAQGCDTGWYADSSVPIGMLLNGSSQGVIARGATYYSFKTEDSNSNLLSGVDGSGRDVRRKAKYDVYTEGQTINETTVVATCAATAGITIHLPTPTGINTERELYLKNPTASSGSIFFGGAVENGTGSFIVSPGSCIHCISDGTKWIQI